MLLAAESHERLERFFREHFNDPACGCRRFSLRSRIDVRGAFHWASITSIAAPPIFVLQEDVRRAMDGRLTFPARLPRTKRASLAV